MAKGRWKRWIPLISILSLILSLWVSNAKRERQYRYAEQRLHAAERAVHAGFGREALKILKDVPRNHQSQRRERLEIEAYLAKGNIDKAAHLVEISREPTEVDLLLDICDQYRKKGKLSKAYEFLKKMEDRCGEDADEVRIHIHDLLSDIHRFPMKGDFIAGWPMNSDICVWKDEGGYYFLDKKGIDLLRGRRFQAVYPLACNRFIVRVNTDFFVVNEQGEALRSPAREKKRAEDVVIGQTGGKFLYVDADGNAVSDTFDMASNVKDGVGFVREGMQWYRIVFRAIYRD